LNIRAGESQSQSGLFAEENNLFHLLETEPRFLGRAARILVTAAAAYRLVSVNQPNIPEIVFKESRATVVLIPVI
jgi:hypothetical protein